MNLRAASLHPANFRRSPVRSRILTNVVRRTPHFDFVEIKNDVQEISQMAQEIEATYRGPAEVLPFSPKMITLKKVSNL